MPGGYSMTVIYIRLMLESLEDDCILYYEGYFENLVQELALKLDVSEDEINMTMGYFTKCGLIQIDSDGNAELPQAKAMVESETNHARYMRNSRKKKNENLTEANIGSHKVNNVNRALPIGYPEKEKEIEKELEKEIDIESEVELKQPAPAEFNIYAYYQQRIGVMDGYQQERLKDFLVKDGLEPELVKRAIDRAADNSKRNFGYVNAILKNWAQNGVKTIVQQDEEQRNFKEKSQKPVTNVPFWSQLDYKAPEGMTEEEFLADE